MKIQLASITARAGVGPARQMVDEYLGRTGAFLPVEAAVFRTEGAFLASLEKARGRTAPLAVLLDGRGAQMSSTELAGLFREQQNAGTQLLVFAVGPADGWSAEARAGAPRLLSLGPMTLPHELARVVMAEQIYRACTILAGHPYHSGH